VAVGLAVSAVASDAAYAGIRLAMRILPAMNTIQKKRLVRFTTNHGDNEVKARKDEVEFLRWTAFIINSILS
jgi:hypothetical protein